jgi:uncharacterized membrane protein
VTAILAMLAALARFAQPEQLRAGRHLIRATVPALLGLFLVIEAGIVLIGTGVEIEMVRLVVLAFGLLLAVMGNMMPKTRPNAYAGLRLPWTLSDLAIWQAAHRASGLVSLVAGVLLVAVAIFTGNVAILLLATAAATAVPIVVGVVVSWRLGRQS